MSTETQVKRKKEGKKNAKEKKDRLIKGEGFPHLHKKRE